MKINSIKAILKLATTGAVLLGGAIVSGQFAPSASAFSLGDNGSITVYQNATDNPEGKSDVGRYFWVNFEQKVDYSNDQSGERQASGLASLALFRVDGFQINNGITSVNLNAKLFAGIDTYGRPLAYTERFQGFRASGLSFNVDGTGTSDTTIDGGIAQGNTGEFNISFNLAGPSSQFTLSNFGIRYEGINSQYYALQDGTSTVSGEAVPEPLTILGTAMALGFGGLFQKEYSKKQKSTKA